MGTWAWEYSTDKVTFLDVDLCKETKDGTVTLEYHTHFKQTNSFQYVDFKSHHPIATKKGIVKGELNRISRTTSNPETREHTLNFLEDKFRQRGYPQKLLTKARASLSTDNPPPKTISTMLKLPFVRDSHLIRNIVRTTWANTISEPALHKLFPTPPMVVYTKVKNLSNYIVRSASPGQATAGSCLDSIPPPTVNSRVHPCYNGHCQCCSNIFNTHIVEGITLRQHLNCKSSNVIYLLKCRRHPSARYIGQTSRQLNQRLRGHRASVRHPGSKSEWPLYRHFADGHHDTDDLLISPLESVRKNKLLDREMFWINKLKTYRPPGLNSAHSINT